MEKPLITIVMATYNPRMDWFKEQVQSLEDQTYPNLKLIVCDDCSPDVPFEEIKKVVSDIVKSFPVEFYQNEHNMGSNKTFERLTSLADGDYISYCDQDDIWCPEKLETLEKNFTGTDNMLICSDMYVMDGEGKRTYNSITEARPFHIFQSGEGLSSFFLTRNFVTGCCMMIRADLAKEAIPFPDCYVHDHYLALYASCKGDILSIPDRLINYRIHGSNQTSVFKGVQDKQTYIKFRLETLLARAKWLKKDFKCAPQIKKSIDEWCDWVEARYALLNGDRKARKTVQRIKCRMYY